MELPAIPVTEEPIEAFPFPDAPPPKLEEQDLDLIALELWKRGSCPEAEVEDGSEPDEVVGPHSSCL